MATPTVILKPKHAQPFFGRHPWVFAGAVDKVEGKPANGDEVILKASNGTFLARGLYNDNSKILVRNYGWVEDQPLDAAFFRAKIARAIGLRHDVLHLNTGPKAAYRVISSEADGLSGLTVDRYAEWLTVQFTSLALANRKEMFAEILRDLLTPQGIYVRTEKGIGKLEGLELHDGLLWGVQPPTDLTIEENGLRFRVDLTEGQKTGYYLDQRDNRVAVAKMAAGKRVLDAFSYSGGFGLYCAKAGATSVECIDASESALKLAEANAIANGLSSLEFTQGDVFAYLAQLVADKKTFDILILDPPKFARNRAALPDAIRGYKRLHQLAMKLLAPDGILVTCCCTGLIVMDELIELIGQIAVESKRDLQILERRGPAADHPVSANCLEGSYLKCIISRVG